MISRRPYNRITVASVVVLLLVLAGDAVLLRRRARYEQEIGRLRQSMTALELDRSAQIVAHERNKVRVAIELLRRQARGAQEMHLSVTLDSSTMYLERDGVVLREMPIHIGPERRVGIAPDTVRLATPRGERTIADILTENSVWEVPSWVYADRGITEPEMRTVAAALGPVAILMEGGTLIYSLPSAGPLADSAYVLPGAIRARVEDLRAILPSLRPGQRVYFY